MNIFNTPPSPCFCIHPCEEANSHLFNPTPLLFSWILEVRGSKAVARDAMGRRAGGRAGVRGRSPYGSSKGSKLVIRRSRGSKLPGCNFHPQIYDLASRGLYSIETTPLTAPPKGYCKSPPSNPQCHHTPSHTHTSILHTHTHTLTDLSFPFFGLLYMSCYDFHEIILLFFILLLFSSDPTKGISAVSNPPAVLI